MKELCTTSCPLILIIFLTPILQPAGRVLGALRLLEDWKKAFDSHECAAAILMDLSKAFDCLPHDLLLEKLRAYGLPPNAVGLM